MALFDDNGEALTVDINSDLVLWDAGSEVNQVPGAGPDQAPFQAAPATGEDENGNVEMESDAFDYPAANTQLKVTITHVI